MNGLPLPLTGKAQPLQDLAACCVSLECKSFLEVIPASSNTLAPPTGGSNRTERVMGTKLTNARRLAMDTQSGGKQVHAIRIVGCTTGALMLVASGSVDLFQ